MKIEIYQAGEKVTEIDLSSTIPAELWITSPRALKVGRQIPVHDFSRNEELVEVLEVSETDIPVVKGAGYHAADSGTEGRES